MLDVYSASDEAARNVSCHGAGAVGGRTNVDFRLEAGGAFIGFMHREFERAGALSLDKADSATSESAAGHSGAKHACDFFAELDHEIQLFATDFEIITEASVRTPHQLAKMAKVTSFQRRGGLKDPGILSNDVAATFLDDSREVLTLFVELIESHIPQAAEAMEFVGEETQARFAFGAPGVVFAVRVRMFDHGIANHQTNVIRNGQRSIFQGTAIQKKSVIASSVNGHKLVHDSAACSHKIVFCALAEQGQIRAVHVCAGDIGKGAGGSDFQ